MQTKIQKKERMAELTSIALTAYAEVMNIPRNQVTIESHIRNRQDFYLWALHYQALLKSEQSHAPSISAPRRFPSSLKNIILHFHD